MKIVNRTEFLQLPSGVLYSEYESSGMVNGLYEKSETWGNDWIYVDLLGDIEASDSTEFHEAFQQAEKGKEFTLDYECGRRDGAFDDNAMFMVYNKMDLYKLIGQLAGIANKYGA